MAGVQAQGFVVWCDQAGRIMQVLRDDLGLGARPGGRLAECLDSESADKALAFLREVRQHGLALDWELHAAPPSGPCCLYMNGFLIEERLLVAGSRRSQDEERYRDEMMRLSNDLATAQRELKKQNISLEAQVQARTRLLETANQDLQAQVTERQRAEAKLAQSNRELRELTSRLERAREEERRHLSRELHDVLGGDLTALKMEVAAVSRQLTGDNEAARANLSELGQHVDRILQVVRNMAANLRPGLLDDFGLVAALEWQTAEFKSRSNINCTFMTELDAVDLDGDKPIALFRILQEALTNIARHAQATAVEVSLSQDPHQVILEIRDNGRGFDTTMLGHTGSVGLVGMRERARLAGGELDVISYPGQGTTIRATIPRSASP